MEHHFSVEVAKEYGVNCAVLLNNLYYWQKHNEAIGRNFVDGRYWTYNSVKAFSEQFPYLSAKAIRTALDKLQEEGLVVTGEYNKDKRDRTKWYSVTDKGSSLLGEAELPSTATSFAPNGNSNIQIENADTKPNKKTTHKGFTPPTLEEIETYIKEKGLSVSPSGFYNYFTEGNWIDSKGNKVKSWKQKLLTWENMRKPTEKKQIGEVL
jgi:DNA-binding PadR family transcriptional regulator